jgi:hypothetical protein
LERQVRGGLKPQVCEAHWSAQKARAALSAQRGANFDTDRTQDTTRKTVNY